MKNYLLPLLILGAALVAGCAKEPSPPQPLPDVTGVAPMNVPVGATVVITGSSFSPILANNQVTFNGMPGTVSAATPTQLTATVPPGAFTDELLSAEIRVTTEGRRSLTPIVLTSDRFPTVTAIEPSSGPVGTVITIRGRNFNLAAGGSEVLFWGFTANTTNPQPALLSVTSTAIQVAVPAGTKTGDVCVYSYNRPDKSTYYVSCQPFTVTP